MPNIQTMGALRPEIGARGEDPGFEANNVRAIVDNK